MIPRYGGNPGPTGGWGRGKAGLPAGGFLGGPWIWGFGWGTPAAPSITSAPPVPPSAAPSPGRVGAKARPPPSRQLVTSGNNDKNKTTKRWLDVGGWGHGDRTEAGVAVSAHSGGGGLVRAHTTDLQWPVLCQLCPGRQPTAGWEIPRERTATVGLIPFHLQTR